MRLELDEKRQVVAISDGDFMIEMTLADVEAVVEVLGRFRKKMEPPVQERWPVDQACPVIVNPGWMVEPDGMIGGALLHMRDTRYGWLHYIVPPNEAGALGALLLRISEKFGEAKPSGPMN